MATPTEVTTNIPYRSTDIVGSDIDAGNNDYVLSYHELNNGRGFSIVTGTLTAVDVTILGSNKDTVLKDFTNDLVGSATLASNKVYMIDIPQPCKKITVRVARTNATNAVNLTIFAPKR